MWVRVGSANAVHQLLTSDRSAWRRAGSIGFSWLLIAMILWASSDALAQGKSSRSRPKADKNELAGDDDADTPVPFHVQPEDEFVIPSGEIKPGEGRHVLLEGAGEKLVVGRIHVEGDKRYLVMMPNGAIVSVDKKAATITDRPFEISTVDEIEAALMLNESFEDFQTKRTKRFLYIYNCSDAFSKATSTILETMYPKLLNFCKNLDLPIKDPEFPLVVIMFADRESFDDYRPMPSGVAAYYSMMTNHIVMYEDKELTDIAPTLALRSAVSTIAHEGVHQILYNVGVQQRFSRWPMWMGEGLAEYCAPTETGKRIRWRGLGLVNNLRMWSLLTYHDSLKKKKKWFRLEELIEGEQLTALGYAHAWATVYAMAKSRKTKDKFAACLRDLSTLGPLEAPPEPGYYYRKHFGDDFKENTAIVVQELGKAKKKYLDPIENQTYFLGVIQAGPFYKVKLSPSPREVREWAKKYADGYLGKRTRLQKLEAYPSRTEAERALKKYKRTRR